MASKWLLKSDPDEYSFSDLVRDGRTVWEGVSNNLALKHLRNARRGDLALIYHTGNERAVVGTAEILTEPYADPKKKDPRLVVVEVAARENWRGRWGWMNSRHIRLSRTLTWSDCRAFR